MTIEHMRKRKRELGLSYERIAELSGLPLGTVQKALGGITKVPRQATLQALEKAFWPSEKYQPMYEVTEELSEIQESNSYAGRKTRQGEYNLNDYYAFPDDRRIELIDGFIYDMAAPNAIHQLLVARIWGMIDRHITEKKGSCIPLFSPLDVQLDRDDKTMVQPDVIVICDRSRLDDHVYGEPDLVVEVLSPSTKKIDNLIKMRKYAEAGVKEYWIVDPEKKKVLVYNFEEGDWPSIYGFEDKIPVHIFPEPWELDFSEIYEYVRFMYER